MGAVNVRCRVRVAKSGVADLDADGGSLDATVPKAAADAFGEGQQGPLDDLGVASIPVEGVLVADRARHVVIAHWGGVDAPGALGERDAVSAEPAHEDVRRQDGQVADGLDAVVGKPPSRLLTDAPQSPDGQWCEECRLGPWRHDHQAIGFAQVRRDLGHQPGRCHTDRSSEAEFASDGRPDVGRDAIRGTPQGEGARDIQERLVDGDLLHQRCRASQDVHERAADLGVALAADGHEDTLRAQRRSRPKRHRRTHPEPACLV